MNKSQAKEHAKTLYSKRVSVYTSKYGVAVGLGIPPKKLTDAGEKKVLTEFYALVAQGNKYPVIDQLFAEDKVNG